MEMIGSSIPVFWEAVACDLAAAALAVSWLTPSIVRAQWLARWRTMHWSGERSLAP
jgi:hypothetical protein